MKRLLLALSACILSGCVSLTPAPIQQHMTVQPWATRYYNLRRLANWQLSGAFSVTTPRQQPIIADYVWQQKMHHYHVEMASSLNIATVTITGNPHWATLVSPNLSQPVTAASAEALMQEQLGWQLPVSNLRYWLLGMPAPAAVAHGSWDQYGHLSKLVQDGFTVEFSDYQTALGVDIPGVISIQGHNLAVKIVNKSLASF